MVRRWSAPLNPCCPRQHVGVSRVVFVFVFIFIVFYIVFLSLFESFAGACRLEQRALVVVGDGVVTAAVAAEGLAVIAAGAADEQVLTMT